MNAINKFSDSVFRLEKFLVVLCLSVMFISLSGGVVFRYFLNTPLQWTGEFAIFSLIFVTFIGGSMTIKLEQSAAVSYVVDRLSMKMKHIVMVLSHLIVFLFCVYFFILSITWISGSTIPYQVSASMEIPMIFPYLSVVIGMGFMCVHSLAHLVNYSTREVEA